MRKIRNDCISILIFLLCIASAPVIAWGEDIIETETEQETVSEYEEIAPADEYDSGEELSELSDFEEAFLEGSETASESQEDHIEETNATEVLTELSTPELLQARSVDYCSVEIKWKAVAGAKSYILYYKGEKEKKYKRIAEGITDTNYIHKSSEKFPLVTGQTYIYTVRAVCDDLVSGYVKNGITVAPMPGKARMEMFTAQSYNKVKLTWTKVPGATGYAVYDKPDNGKWVRIATVKSNVYTGTGSGKNPIKTGVTYHYMVRAYRTAGKQNVYGGYAENEVQGKTMPATAKLISIENLDKGKIQIRWKKASGANSYWVYRKTAGKKWERLAKVSAKNSSYTHVSSNRFPIEVGVKYWYTVRSYTTAGNTLGNYEQNGISVKASAGAPEDIKARANAKKLFNKITTKDMTQAEKLKACFDWTVSQQYHGTRIMSYETAGWSGLYANDLFVRGGGDCISFACAFAYLAKAAGYQNVKVGLDSATDLVYMHGWTEINGIVYDPLFSKWYGYGKNFEVSYDTYSLKPAVRIPVND